MPALPATPAPPSTPNAGSPAKNAAQAEAAVDSPFSLLLGGANGSAPAPAPLLPADGLDAGGDADAATGIEVEVIDDTLPGQLLGLLDGSMFTPAAARGSPTASAAPAVSMLPGAYVPGIAMPPLHTDADAPPLPGAHVPGLAMPPLHTDADAPPSPVSATLAMAIQNAASGASAASVPEGDAQSTALAQALPQAAISAQAAPAGTTFDTLVRDAVGPASADTGGIEPAPLTSTSGASTTSVSAVRASPLAQPLPMPADPSAGFDDGLSTRIAWMAEQGIGRAELRVNPDHAGPIEVRLQMDGTRLTAEFHAINADTRQALEAGMQRLRDMLGQQGLQLAQSHVGSGGGQGRQDGSNPGMGDGVGHADGGDIAAGDTAPARWVTRGLLDEYA